MSFVPSVCSFHDCGGCPVFFCLSPAFAAPAVGFDQKRYDAISSQDLAAQLGGKYP